MTRVLFLVSSLVIVTILGTFSDVSAQSYSSYYYGNQIMCPMDAYVCADGTTVGRTGSNCQFVCPITVTQTPSCTGTYQNYCTGLTPPSSYYYTSGCYTYYYNGYTRTTSVTSYNCQTTVAPYQYQYYQPSNSYYIAATQYHNNYTYPVASQYYVNYTYPVRTTYSTPVTYAAPTSQYQTYSYCNGSWILSSQRGNNCNNIFGF